MQHAVPDETTIEQEVGISSNTLWRIFDSVPGVMGYVDTSETVLMVNRAHENRHGHPREQVIGRPLCEVVGADNYRVLKPYVDRALAGDAQEFEYDAALTDGADRIFRVSFTPDLANDGSVEGYFYTSFDVTDTHSLLQGDWDSHWKHADLIQSLPLGMLVMQQGNVLFANPDAKRILGVARSTNVMEKDIEELIRALEARSPQTDIEQLSAHQSRVVSFTDRYGNSSQLEVRSRTIRWREGDALLLAISDVTAQADAEKALREQRARLHSVIELAEDAIIEFDVDGKVWLFNSAAERMLGISSEMALNSPLDLIFNCRVFDEAGDGFTLERLKDLATVNAPAQDCRLQRSDHRSAKLLARRGKSEKREIFVLTVRDVTAEERLAELRRKVQTEAIHKQRIESLGTLAGGIAHELNNLLVPIVTMIELSLETVEDRPAAKANLSTANDAARLAARLVEQILQFSRHSDSSEMTTKIAVACEEAIDLIRVTSPPTICIRQQLPAEDVRVAIDFIQLHQIIVNLVTNAIHAIGEKKGEISIEVRIESAPLLPGEVASPAEGRREAVISVSDNGSGIPGEILHRIFDPFFTTKGVGEGTGMGLAVINGIVTAAGGTITARSNPGVGTTFEVSLPIVSDVKTEDG